MPLTVAGKDIALDALFRRPIYIGLRTAAGEPGPGYYRRQAVTFGLAEGGDVRELSNAEEIRFASFSVEAGGKIVDWFVADAVDGGTVIGEGSLDRSLEVQGGEEIVFRKGDLRIAIQ